MFDTEDTTHTGRFLEAPIGAARKPRGVRWRRMLVFFMRLSACIWMLRGLTSWMYIIGLLDGDFPALRLSRQGIIISGAVLDLIAAVGLWMASSWGAAVWLLRLIIEAALPFLVPDMTRPVTDALIAITFGAIYVALVWRAVREEQET